MSFAAGAFLAVASGLPSVGGTEQALGTSAPVILFLFSLFLFAGALERAGALDHLARWILGRARTASELPAVLFLGFGVAAAFLVNDALVLIGVPLLISVARRIRVPPAPLLLVLAFSVTVGSVLTPFGNPQNLLVSIESGVSAPVSTFLRYLLLPTAINLGVGAWYVHRTLGAQVRADPADFDRLRTERPPLFPSGGWGERLRRSPVLFLFPGTMAVAITLDVTAALTNGPVIPIWETVGAGAILLLLVSSGRTELFGRVDWSILILFGALFVVVAALVSGGVIAAAESVFPIPGPGAGSAALAPILGTSFLGPQVVSNVPWVALQIPILTGLGYGSSTPTAWMALAAGSTLAGNVTLLGAASNIIVADLAGREKIPFRLGTFFRYGAPLAAITFVVLAACLYFGL